MPHAVSSPASAPQQLYLLPTPASDVDPAIGETDDSSYLNLPPADTLVEQTRQLFGYPDSNAELMSQVIQAIEALHPIYEASA